MPLAAMLLSWRFNRSSATIPLPTLNISHQTVGDCKFQSLKRDHSSSDDRKFLFIYSATALFQSLKRDHSSSDIKLWNGLNIRFAVSIAQARPFLFRPK